MGAGRSHLDWMKELLAAGPLQLTLTTANYINPMRSVVIGRRFAVGDPTGTNAPIVMVGAHIDSVLGAPGAHDDASGNGVSMEIARVVSKLPLDKEIRIGGFGGEEDGLTGSRAYVATLPAEERARFVGEWQMDMVGTPYAPAKLWALTPDGRSNFVVDEAYNAAARFGFSGLQNCKLGQSDHQAFFDVGIPSALFIWLDYNNPVPPATCESIPRGTYTTEPEYHRPMDGMKNISPERLQTTLDVVGGAFAHNALNSVTITGTPRRPADRGRPTHGQLRRRPARDRRPRRGRDADSRLPACDMRSPGYGWALRLAPARCRNRRRPGGRVRLVQAQHTGRRVRLRAW
jgi:hypothetical protein